MSYKPWLVKLLPELAEILATQQLNTVAKLVPAPDPVSKFFSSFVQFLPGYFQSLPSEELTAYFYSLDPCRAAFHLPLKVILPMPSQPLQSCSQVPLWSPSRDHLCKCISIGSHGSFSSHSTAQHSRVSTVIHLYSHPVGQKSTFLQVQSPCCCFYVSFLSSQYLSLRLSLLLAERVSI